MVANNNSNRDSIYGLFLTFFLLISSIFFTANNEITKTIFVIEKGMSLNAVTNLLYEKDIIHNKSFLNTEYISKVYLTKFQLEHFLLKAKSVQKILFIQFLKKVQLELD